MGRATTENVLIVDDEAAILRSAQRILECCGYRVWTAGGGEDALRVLASLDGPLHLLLTDVDMPGIGGPELAAQVVASHPETRVLYSSGGLKDPQLRARVSEGTEHFLAKPYSSQDLGEKVRLVLNGRSSSD